MESGREGVLVGDMRRRSLLKNLKFGLIEVFTNAVILPVPPPRKT